MTRSGKDTVGGTGKMMGGGLAAETSTVFFFSHIPRTAKMVCYALGGQRGDSCLSLLAAQGTSHQYQAGFGARGVEASSTCLPRFVSNIQLGSYGSRQQKKNKKFGLVRKCDLQEPDALQLTWLQAD